VKTVSGNVVRHSLAQLTLQKLLVGGRPLVPEILDQSGRIGAKLRIFDLFLLVAPQP